MDPIMAALDSLEVGTPVTVANLTMYPLLLLEESAPGYLTLDEALAAGLASVTEVSESGRVPELLVKNLAGVDVFDSQATWRKSMRKLVESYGLDALDHAEARGHVGASEGGSDAKPQPKRFLATLKKTPQERFHAIGLGEDVRINGSTIVGGGLVVDDKVIHLVAFPGAKHKVGVPAAR